MFSSETDEKGITPSDLITSAHNAYVVSENTAQVTYHEVSKDFPYQMHPSR